MKTKLVVTNTYGSNINKISVNQQCNAKNASCGQDR